MREPNGAFDHLCLCKSAHHRNAIYYYYYYYYKQIKRAKCFVYWNEMVCFHIYIDEVELANPLSSKKGKHKVFVFLLGYFKPYT
jgi:hypothetical protein